MTARPEMYRFHNGEKAKLPFSEIEYEARLKGLRQIMEDAGAQAVVLTSMHNIAYYSGFLYCAFGRPYGLVVTDSDCVTISAGIVEVEKDFSIEQAMQIAEAKPYKFYEFTVC